MEKTIDSVYNKIHLIDSDVVLLKEKEVIQWLFGDTSFLLSEKKVNKKVNKKALKKREDSWGKEMLQLVYPDFNSTQWTGPFGERIVNELYKLIGKSISKPKNKNGFEPDFETDDFIIEVKSQTYYTDGTAGEKILGSPLKYADVPELYSKPLNIICIGNAEKMCKEHYKIIGPTTRAKQKILSTYEEIGIIFIGITELLTEIKSEVDI
jgi:hypothetical protein